MAKHHTQFNQIHKLLMEVFKGDAYKVFLWLHTKNPHLGNVSPIHLLGLDKADKVLKFIKACKSENLGWK